MTRKKKNAIAYKSYAFALRIIKLYKFLLSKQVLRNGSSVGALTKEMEYAQSKAGFINKMNIAPKEAKKMNDTIIFNFPFSIFNYQCLV